MVQVLSPQRSSAGTMPRRLARASVSFAPRSTTRSGLLAALTACVGWLALGSAAWAQLPTAQLSSIFPPGGKIGATFDAELFGTDLDDVHTLVFSHPGITAVQKTGPGTLADKSPQPLSRQFTLTISGSVPAGIYEVRTMGRYGASNPRAFTIGSLNEVTEKDPAGTVVTAKPIALETTVNAAGRAERADFFKFTARKGQRLVIDCCARRIDSRLDASMIVFDDKGRELARNKERVRRDPLVDFLAPADGYYVLKIYDFLYKGGNEYFYRLTLSAAPYLDFVLPPVGRPGSKDKYTLYGRNLPGGTPANFSTPGGLPLQQLEVEIALPAEAPPAPAAQPSLQPARLVDPTEAGQEAFTYRLPAPQASLNAVDIFYTSIPVVRGQKPTAAASPQKLAPPCEVIGQFNPRGDQDWYTFEAKKGDVFWIEIYSQRLGLPTDPYLLVQRISKGADGKEQVSDVAELDDPKPNAKHDRFETHYSNLGNDPALRFEAPEDGTYRILARDLYYESRGNPSYVYRLAVRRSTPDFSLTTVVESPLEQQNINQTRVWSPLLHKGEITGVTVLASRQDDFTSEIRLTVEGLPPGITCPGATIGPGADVGTLVFSAAEKVEPWAGPIRVVGHAMIQGREVIHDARIGTIVWGTPNREQEVSRFRTTGQMFVAISPTDIPMVKVELGEAKDWETSVGGKVLIPVKITRHGEFKGRVKLQAAGLPREITVPDLDLAEAATDGKLDVTVRNVPPGTYTLSCRVDTRLNYRHNPEAASSAAETAKAMEKIAADAATAARMATDAKGAAERAANDAAAAAKQAADALTAARKAADDAQAKLKPLDDAAAATAKSVAEEVAKSQAAKAAADKAPADKAAAEAARKAVEASTQAAQKNDAAKAAVAAAKAQLDAAKAASAKAEMKVAETAALAKATGDAKAAADAALQAATTKSQMAEGEKQAAANRARAAADMAQPRDINVVFYSTPMLLKIAASPVTTTVPPPAQPAKAGGHIELPVSIKRLYGFADTVYVAVAPSPTAPGVHSNEATIPAGQTEGKIAVDLDPSAAVGDHSLVIRTHLNFNGQGVQFDQPLAIKVLPPDKK